MRRLVLWSLAALAACSNGGGDASTATGTVAVGELPATMPGPSTTTTTTTTTDVPPTSAPSDPTTVLADELVALFDGATAPAPPMDLVRDDSGRLHLQVPAEWQDRRTAPTVEGGGIDAPSIAASPDVEGFLDGYDVAGTTAVVVDEAPAAAVAPYRFDEDCEPMRRGAYRGEQLDGVYRSWRACGGTGTAIVAVAGETDDGDTVLVLAQLIGPADLAALDATLGSVRVSG